MKDKVKFWKGYIKHYCPGCMTMHVINIGYIKYICEGDKLTIGETVRHYSGDELVCSYSIKKNKMIFGKDCLHFEAGKTLALPKLPEAHKNFPDQLTNKLIEKSEYCASVFAGAGAELGMVVCRHGYWAAYDATGLLIEETPDEATARQEVHRFSREKKLWQEVLS